ncbi:MAG: hypothetical protein HYT76_04555 [Deltaproteobacteria bacterium]|nr:hypothetical protein [Deltaproteobacteria bacterium]
MEVVDGLFRSAVPELDIDVLFARFAPRDDSPQSFSIGNWTSHVGRGFVNEGVESFRGLFSVGGAALAIGIGMIARQYEGLLKGLVILGVGGGAFNIFRGLVMTFRGDEAGQGKGAEQIGRGLFYCLPLTNVLKRRVTRSHLRREAYRNIQSRGEVVKDQREFIRLSETLDRRLDKMLEPYEEPIVQVIREAHGEPVFNSEYEIGVAAASFPNTIHVADRYNQFLSPRMRDFFKVVLSLDKLHESRHLTKFHDDFPMLWDYCIENEVEGTVEILEVIKNCFRLRARHESRLRDVFTAVWKKDRQLIREAVKYRVYEWTRRDEIPSFQEEYWAVRETLGGIDWERTFTRLYQRFEKREMRNWWERFKEWFQLREMRQTVRSNLVIPFGLTESQYVYYRTRGYDLFKYFGESDHLFYRSAYLFFYAHDAGIRLVRMRGEN